jgi:N-acetylglucosaminyl-diphospho-decaprenol L-rhamnosyltransferase
MSETDSVAPTVAVVTVSYNSADALGPFLESISIAGLSPLALVVDNASPMIDLVREVVARAGAQLLELPENLGYGTAMNRGIASLPSSVRWVLVSNPDVLLHPGALGELVHAAGERPDAGAIGPQILQPDGTVYPSARRLPSLRVGIGHALFARALPRNPWTRRYQADEHPAEVSRDAGWLSGACLLVVRSVFDQVHGFDEGYFMYFEDVDLGARISRHGFANVYWPSAVVTHTGAHSTSTRAGTMERAHHASAYRYVSRKYRAWYLWPLRVSLRVGIGVRSLLLTRRS